MNWKNPKTLILLLAALALLCAPFKAQTTTGTQATSAQGQRPAGRGAGRAQGAANQTNTSNTATPQNGSAGAGSDVVQLRPQDLLQTPLRVGIQNALQEGMKQQKPNAAATLTLHTVAGNSAQTPVPSTVPNAASSVQANPSAQPNAAANAMQNGSRNANLSSSGPPAVNRAANPSEPAAAPTGAIPPAIEAGIKAMVNSKASLENAGSKWGGHKEPAIRFIDEALKACGQTVTPDNGGTKSNPAGDTPAMQAALAQLTAAQKYFTIATNPWGGRRDQALALIKQALAEVQSGIAYAKSHNVY